MGLGAFVVAGLVAVVDLMRRARRKGFVVRDGFDFAGFELGIAEFDFFAEDFDGALDADGEAIELAHEGGDEGQGFGEDVIDAEAHGFAVEVLDLEEADLHLDELVDEGDLGGGDGVELFDVVGDDGEGDVVVGDEVVEVADGVEAVLERVGGGLEFAGGGTGAGGLESVGPVGSERGFRHGLLTRGNSLAGWINRCGIDVCV